MNIVYITHYFPPHVGGVENHVDKISRVLAKKGNSISVITEDTHKHTESGNRKNFEVFLLNYSKIRFVGLVSIWFKLQNLIKNLKNTDIIHIHDVFIWYLPLAVLYPNRKIIITIHGFEWDRPLLEKSLFQKKIAVKLSDKSVGIGHFLEKYLNVKFDLISYGASDIYDYKTPKDNNRIVYVGRLEENTGLLKFLKWLDRNPGCKVDFCGDGDLRAKCEKHGTVHGFTNPNPFYKTCKTVVPGGYLAALEALNSGCDIKLFWNNKLKEDYWKMSPFYKLKGKELRDWARKQTWDKLANEYINLYNSIK